jgi:hypothetical protein
MRFFSFKWFRGGWRRQVVLVILIGIAGIVALNLAAGFYRIYTYQAYHWLPEYFRTKMTLGDNVPDKQKHAIFVFVDHYEPGLADRKDALQNHKTWMNEYRAASEGHVDSYGNRVKYSWFYAYDQKNDAVLASLTKAVYEGLGEVELHWHHPHSNNAKFPGELKKAIDWFGRYGVLKTCGKTVQTAFSFVHGDWALDGATTYGGYDKCGVTREIDILHHQGCYADFTFSTIGTEAQPSKKVNSIYYVTDTDAGKSYDDGEYVVSGKVVDDKMMFIQGPLSTSPFEWWRFEFGALENYTPPSVERVHTWIDTNIHVKGRPEWVFVKLYTHGIDPNIGADKPDLMEKHFNRLLSDIETVCEERGIRFHYMAAREAYNVIKAAEAGKTGNPELFRDFLVPKPCNHFFYTDKPVEIFGFENNTVLFQNKTDG